MTGIIGAMEGEIQGLRDLMDNISVICKSGMDFYKGILHGEPVVVVQSGVGKVNAGICAALLINVFCVDNVINTGIAGSLDNKISIGDIVLSTDAVQHDFDATSYGKYDYGHIPGFKEPYFKADEHLRQMAEKASERINSDINVFSGRIVSGDQFICDNSKKKWLKKRFDAFCTEMEGAAVAQAAVLGNIPFLIIRAISDKADDNTTVDFQEFQKKAMEHSVKLTSEIIRIIKEEKFA